MDKIKELWSKRGIRYTILGVLALVLLLFGVRACNQAKKSNTDTSESTKKVSRRDKSVALTPFEEEQKRLIRKYGEAGEGYYWSEDGTRMALGDQNLSETEVIRTFLRSLSTLDFATAQKYAYKDQVLKTLNAYYNSESEFTYSESFKKAMYQQFLLSMEIEGIESQATFADDKSSVTVKIKALDLSNKDFWKEDKDALMKGIYSYRKTEADSTKARNFLYEYVTNYWKSEVAQKKAITINLTLTKTGAGGWLISNDMDLDNYAKYSEGETVINNILKDYDLEIAKRPKAFEESSFDPSSVLNKDRKLKSTTTPSSSNTTSSSTESGS